jgi:peptidyl-dipeptidase Dcp
LALENGKKAFKNNEFDNQNLIKEIISLKQQKAEILGYKTTLNMFWKKEWQNLLPKFLNF